ncbi:hypothetical protein ACO2Q3_05915 [Caulobacter sp. KR2-114]|uniref:hypothetical protein n=1 Tax=Caulobacter sp. KR2-114 TaxID=3400912 RepID=UPI003C000834
MLSLAASLALAGPAAAQIESRPLAVIDAFSTGAGGPGLGADLWQGASTPLVRQVLPTLGQRPMSPAAAMLARHVLATGATAPDGAGADSDLAGQRLLALIDLGGARAADAIARTAPDLADSEPLARAAAEAALTVRQEARACAISQGLQVGRDGAYWLELRAFCQAMAGDLDKAQTTYSLANEAAKDVVYRRLMGAKLLGSGAPPAPSLRDGLDLALVRSLAIDPTPALDGASPAVAAELARDATLPPEVRLAAAARAVRGAVTLDDLFDGGQPPLWPAAGPDAAAQDPAAAIKALALKPGVAAEAGLVALALRQSDAAAAGAALDALFGRAKTPGDFIALARLAIPAVRALAAPDKALASPLRLACAAVAANDPQTARAIRARISRESVGASDLALLDAAIAALGPGDPQTMDRLAERGGHDGAKAPTQAAAVLFLALGDPLSADARAEVAGFDVGRSQASAAKLALLDSAAGAKAKGEAAILALSLAADAGAAGLAPADRARVVAALRRAGLEADARALDAEGLLSLK